MRRAVLILAMAGALSGCNDSNGFVRVHVTNDTRASVEVKAVYPCIGCPTKTNLRLPTGGSGELLIADGENPNPLVVRTNGARRCIDLRVPATSQTHREVAVSQLLRHLSPRPGEQCDRA